MSFGSLAVGSSKSQTRNSHRKFTSNRGIQCVHLLCCLLAFSLQYFEYVHVSPSSARIVTADYSQCGPGTHDTIGPAPQAGVIVDLRETLLLVHMRKVWPITLVLASGPLHPNRTCNASISNSDDPQSNEKRAVKNKCSSRSAPTLVTLRLDRLIVLFALAGSQVRDRNVLECPLFDALKKG
jgi:hypothetical protein